MTTAEIYERAMKSEFIVLDCEASSLDWKSNELWMLGIGSTEWCDVVENLDVPFFSMLKKLFAFKKIIFHNGKWDLHVLRRFGLDITSIRNADIEDTMLMSQLIEENGRHDLQALMKQRYKFERDEKPVVKMDREELKAHCLTDIMDTTILYIDERKEIDDLNLSVAYEIEKDLMKVLWNMEEKGVLIDRSFLEKYSVILGEKLKEIQSQFPNELNLVSAKQVGNYLYNELGLTPMLKTPTGADSTSEDAFKLLKSPIADQILLYRHLAHTKSTFVDPYLGMMDHSFRLHCSYKQLGARTGRLSCVEPNLQQVLNEENSRKIFIGDPWLIADYSQMEAVLFANFSKDKQLIDLFNSNDDVYSIFASKVYKVPLDKVTLEIPGTNKSYRDTMKSIYLGLIYGMGETRFRKLTGEDVYQTLKTDFPGLASYGKQVSRDVEIDGCVRTLVNRYRRLFPHDAYKGVNAKIQGSARDILALVMISLPRHIQDKLVITVHDELDFEDVTEQDKKIIVECMKNFNFPVPMKVKVGIGSNWWDASKSAKVC